MKIVKKTESVREVTKEVIKQIEPNKKERSHFDISTKQFLNKINNKLINAKAVLGGSGAKGTWLSGNHDVDIFVRYNFNKYKEKSLALSEMLDLTLKEVFPKIRIKRLHGSRDYFQMKFKNLNFEIVPILEINKSEDAINITDISPLHAKWVNKKGVKIKNEIRLAKSFCKANKIYGAESYIAGLSGYVVEILTIHYGSFEKLLKATTKWKGKEIIDTENYYPKKDVLFNLNKSKTLSPLVVVDPVDKYRNASAALSIEKFFQIKKLAKSYLKEPNINYFTNKKITYQELEKYVKKNKLNLVFIEARAQKGKEDVIGIKLLKAFHYLEQELKEFNIKKSSWQWNKNKKVNFYLILSKKELPKFIIRKGPPLKMKDYVKDFKIKNKEWYIEKNKLYAKIKTKNPKLNDFIKNLMKKKYFKERIEKVEKILIK